jgi:hypothetical protein
MKTIYGLHLDHFQPEHSKIDLNETLNSKYILSDFAGIFTMFLSDTIIALDNSFFHVADAVEGRVKLKFLKFLPF